MCDSDLDSGFDSSDTSSGDSLDSIDSSDIQGADDIEFLDTSDIELSDTEDMQVGEDISDDVDDGFYHATRLSDEDLDRIDDLWKDEEPADVPVVEDMPDNGAGDGFYHATRLSDEDLQRIDDLNKDEEPADIEPYQARRNSDNLDKDDSSADTDDLFDLGSADSLEEKFAADVEAMNFEDMVTEQARLDELSEMSDLDIFAQYDAEQKGQIDAELYHSLTDGLPRESLEQLRDGLANGDPDVYDFFGLNDTEDGGNDSNSRGRRR